MSQSLQGQLTAAHVGLERAREEISDVTQQLDGLQQQQKQELLERQKLQRLLHEQEQQLEQTRAVVFCHIGFLPFRNSSSQK